ncbi:putative AMP-dependent synthetase/ligase, ANL domain-containing protein [Dioscorea sansibarensis]
MACENYDPCFPDQPVVHLYLPVWANQPSFKSKPAFIWVEDTNESITSSSISYSELNSSVQAMSSHLLQTLHKGDTILILCNPSIQLIKILFACQRAGLMAVPIIPPNMSAKPGPSHFHLFRALSQTKPVAAIANPSFISSLSPSPQLENLLWLSSDELENKISFSDHDGCGEEDVYLIQYTSGATGVPKPVLVTAGAAAHNVRAARKAYDLQPSSVIVSWLPQYHDCGLMFLLLTVITGATCVLTSPANFLNRPRLWLELITEFKATCTPVPSFALPLVAKRGNINHGKLKLELKLSSLRNLILINEPIYKSLVEDFINEFSKAGLKPSSISPSYGLAENCTFVSTSWDSHADQEDHFPNMQSYNKLLPSAKLGPLSSNETADIDIIIVDEETRELVEDGIEGEVWVSSASNAVGYLGHPCMTREVFHARIEGRISKCYLRTGDRGVIKGENRYLYIMGRVSDVIKVDQRWIHPHYLETIAYKSNAKWLRGGCIVAFGVEIPRKSGVAIMVVAELAQKIGNGDELTSICKMIKREIWEEEGVEVGVVALVRSGSVAKTTSGKVRRWMVKDETMRGRLKVVYMEEYLGEDEEKKGVGRRLSLLSFL